MDLITKKITELKTKKIGILGLGINNEKLVDFLLANNVQITICDQDENKNLRLPQYLRNKLISWRLGDNYLDNLTDFDLVFRSPGLPYLHPKLQQAKKKKVEISSQTKLFFELCPAKIIGVTGTKGKGTTATLIYEILKTGSKTVFLAGNIGQDPFDFLSKLKPTDLVVLELSSFQLQDLDKSPQVAVVLNITVDHLDYHKDRAEYLQAKTAITKFQTINDQIILNADYKDVSGFGELSPSQNWYFSTKNKVKQGCYYKNGELYFKTKGTEYKICSKKIFKLKGYHNLENIAAAVLTAILQQVDVKSIKDVLRAFVGLEHHLEYAGKVKGVKYYNDSAATMPEATIAAIDSFDQPLILILGGSDKGADFGTLAQEIFDNKIKAVILVGQLAEKILVTIVDVGKTKFKKTEIKTFTYQENLAVKKFLNNRQSNLAIITGCQGMMDIVKISSQIAKKGDVVLLSPACASFGMFKNAKERGELFKSEVYNLKRG